jgi:hypothetical protein
MYHRPHAVRHLAVPVVALTSTIACLAPAAAPAATDSGPMVTVVESSIIVARPPVGDATVTASRLDPVTGKPVVIGTYTGVANPSLTVNTTAPSSGIPGDCWQKGALSSALTPDLLPGDVVTVAGAGAVLGGPPLTASVTVAPDAKPSSGPIPACADSAPFAQNTITDAPASVTGAGAITLRGRAQPLATGVSVAAADGTNVTPAASAAPAADGTWSATSPADAVARLADGPLTVTPVIAVPDVSTGAQAHIAAAPVTVQKEAAGGPGAGAPGAGSGAAVAGGAGGAAPGTAGGSVGGAARPGSPAPAPGRTGPSRVSALRAPSRVSARTARGSGITASFVVPAGASTVQLQLLRGSTALFTTAMAVRPGARRTVRLSSPSVRRLLRPGRYTLAVRAGTSPQHLGPPLLRGLVVR